MWDDFIEFPLHRSCLAVGRTARAHCLVFAPLRQINPATGATPELAVKSDRLWRKVSDALCLLNG
ncbi:hypothetical protein [Nostoc sp. ChiQUE01b]|uniref:hypothetical protein n=1 Tax=Nostoc sp. ChiQUE01b TaxID=3075376 RepID=UPI002AD28404|nr:hypothetical protein [Nostoc sp. ChiQUE01b]MDZ8258530.1 hypothetical protein [Nostoc sp. ChiQUE01b]